MEVRGSGLVMVTIKSIEHQTNYSLSCVAYRVKQICMLWSKDDIRFDQKETMQVELTSYALIQNGEPGSIDVKIISGEFIEIGSSDRIQV